MDWVKPCHIPTECHGGLDPEGLCAHNVFCKDTQKEFTNVAVLPWPDCMLQWEREGKEE